jgi:hypothetical protein
MPIPKFITDRYVDGGGGLNNLDWSNIAKDLGVAGAIYGIINPNDSSGLASFFGTGGQQQPVGYTGGIPNYTATRELAPNAFTQTYTTPTGEVAPRVPGSAGRRYFTDTPFTQDTATPFMGITAEQIAAQNLAAQNELALFENILGGVETQRKTAATTPTGGITTPTGGITTPTTGTTTTGTTDDGKIDTTGLGNLLVSLGGTRNADGTITDATGGTYSIQDGAWRPVAATTGTTTTGTTDDGKIDTTGLGNLLVSLGGTRNADGTITDATGGTYSIQDGAWRPVAATTGTTTTGTTTTGTAPTAYDNFIASYAAKDVADFTAADYTALASSGYALSDIATSLNVTESSLANALDRYSPENVAFQNFMGSLPTTLSSAEHAQALLNSGYSLEKIASGYTNTTASQLQAFIDGFDTPTTTGTTTTGTTTTGTTTTGTTTTDTTGADAVDTLLNSTEQGMVASGDYTDNGDGTITDSTNGYVYDNDTGEGYFPTTTGTTTTDTTGADAVETLLNSTEQWMVANRGYVDNGDGTITDSTNGYVYDNDTGEGYFPTTDTTGTGETLTLNAADGTTSTIDLTGGAAPLTTTGTANPTAGPLAPTFDMVDASDFLSEQEQDIIYSVMKTSGANIADVAEEFGTTQDDVIEGLLRGGYETPEQIAATLNAVDPDIEFTEEDLIANLLETNKTTPEEVAAYYKDHPVYGGITPEQVKAAFKDLGGTRQFAQGGNVNGYYLGGPTDGMADQIPATIDNMQPAALSDGEFVIPADVVSHLGNGNSDAGAQNLYGMMERVRRDRTGNPKQGKQIDPNKYLA